jgi:hypothetical protein
MMSGKRVAVVMPAYDAEKTLRRIDTETPAQDMPVRHPLRSGSGWRAA